MRDELAWRWDKDTLYDAAEAVLATAKPGALVLSDVLGAGTSERLLLEGGAGRKFVLRGTGSSGALFSVAQVGVSVTRLQGQCEEREYLLDRPSPFRRERRIVAFEKGTGREVARTTPHFRGALTVADSRGGDFPVLDAVFLSYCCFLLDAAPRIVRM